MVSCQFQVDNTNPFTVAEAVHKGLMHDDNILLKKIFKYQLDSLTEQSLENLRDAKKIFAQNKGLKIFKVDTSSSGLAGKRIDIFYKIEKEFYGVSVFYKPNSENIVEPQELFSFNNLNQNCEDSKKEPYKPTWGIEFKGINYDIHYSGKALNKGSVELQNNTKSDLNYIKFKVILKRGQYWSDETFFNQTVESSNPIFRGDLNKVNIPGMTDYPLGFKLDKDASVSFDVELLDVRPKPSSYWCTKLQDIEDKAIENSEI